MIVRETVGGENSCVLEVFGSMFRLGQPRSDLTSVASRVSSLENVYGTVVPRIASVEFELRSFVARMQAVETQLGRERQRRNLAADEAEARPVPAIMGHRGPGATMPAPAPAPAASETASTSPVPMLVTIATPDNGSQRALSLPPPVPARMDAVDLPEASAPPAEAPFPHGSGAWLY